MQETTTTCDRCGKVETEDSPSWSNLWVQASPSTSLDLCDQCGKALLGWVQTGIEVKAGVRVEHPHETLPVSAGAHEAPA